jgi:glycosyltransferase involved in cell wall biosynthesis
MSVGTYILISAARNEEVYIERTILAVTAQTCIPIQWLIISDGSTDRTDEIVQHYADKYPFIRLHRVRPDEMRNFGSKARAINTGYGLIQHLEHDYVGILDVDVAFPANYYEKVMGRMEAQPDLGIAGGVLYDAWQGKFVRQITSIRWSVSGPIQLFRRQCWQQIGGYMAIPGDIDAVAEVMVRMHGWKVQAFPELHVWHHRSTGSEKWGLFGVFLHRGIEDYEIGYHPLFFFLRALRRFSATPWILGSIIMLSGYAWAGIKRKKRKVPEDLVRFLRREQMERLLHSWKGTRKVST